MYLLVTKCLAGDERSWGELWFTYDHVAAQPVRCLLVWAGFDPADADDVAIDIFMRLCDPKATRLKSFRGASEAELKSWLVHSALNFTRDWIRRQWRTTRREKQAIKGHAHENREGGTEQEVSALLEDLESIAPKRDVNRLRKLAGLHAGVSGEHQPKASQVADVSDRAIRTLKGKLKVAIQTGTWPRTRRKPKHTPPRNRTARRPAKKMKNS